MIEYLYDAIRASAGQDITVAAKITDDEGNLITSGCDLMLHNDKEMIARIDGAFDGEVWNFTVPAEITQGLEGRYWYCICHNNSNICFKEPLYLI